MKVAGRRMTSRARSRSSHIAAVLAALAGAGLVLPASVSAQIAPKPVAKSAPAKSLRTGPAKAVAPKMPVAVKNVAVAADAVPAKPVALFSGGCLGGRFGDWLKAALGAAGQPMPAESQRATPSTENGFGEGAEFGDQQEKAQQAGAADCIPFAAVRTPADRIETLAFLPGAAVTESGKASQVMVVSRIDLGSAPTTGWDNLTDLLEGRREVWMQASAVLAGELEASMPHRWQRDVTVLVRRMTRLTHAADTAWVRVVLGDGGGGPRVDALELVNGTTGEALDSAIWIDRADRPGGFVSTMGGDLERVLWQSPVDYQRISRGVGLGMVIVSKRMLAKPKTPGGKPRVVVRSFRARGQHPGVDYVAPAGTAVVTVADGTVLHAGPDGGYGNLVVVDHGGGITTHYAHLSAFGAGVHEGARVARGQEVGKVGSTGQSTGPHLHYEIRLDGKHLDLANPVHSLPNWGLSSEEHHAALTRLLALSVSRQGELARMTRRLAIASAPVSTSDAE